MPKKKITQVALPKIKVLPVEKPEVFVSEANKIWNEIKDVQLNMFALPDQTVEKYCKPVIVEPTKLYIVMKVSSTLTALEDTLGKLFEFQPAGKYVMVVRK